MGRPGGGSHPGKTAARFNSMDTTSAIKEIEKHLGIAEDVILRLANDNERMRAALESIAKNGCCDRCQEAALVAKQALGE